jgi:hypothetical protein
MSEAELREGLRAAVGDEPPLDFDPDELIQRGRHARRRRLALVAVAVATLALTGTVLSLPGVFDPRQGIDVARGPVLTTTPSPSPTPTPSPADAMAATSMIQQTPPPSAAVDTTRYLVDYLGSQFPRVVPGAKVLKVDFTDVGGQDQDQERAGKAKGYVTGYVQFLDAEGLAGVVVQLSAPPLLLTRDQFCASVRCEKPLRQADGSYLEVATVTDPDTKMTTLSVAHFRPGGSVVQVNAYNYDPTRGGDVVRAEVALSMDQLVRLATDPNLAVR